ncbi:MAG: hypothetical protein RSD74_02070 [Angelakisella sp.]
MKINILGTDYTVSRKRYEQDEYFKDNNAMGYCDEALKTIVVCDLQTCPGEDCGNSEALKIIEKETLRHEIIHAFLHESGLQSAATYKGSWAKNEEMIDWIAIQFPKMQKTFEQALERSSV